MSAAEDERARYAMALWWMRYNSPDYELYETEREAADFGSYLEDEGDGVVLGVQFADGRTIARAGWREYREARARRRDEDARRRAQEATRAPVPMREARDPFTGTAVKIEVSEPSWLGAS